MSLLSQPLGQDPAYELITGNKTKVHYFRVFGSKCFIFNKKSKSSKFAPKVDEDFLLGYGTNKHVYHAFNKTTSCGEITVDVTFDESNDSQVEQVDKNLVEEVEPPSVSITKTFCARCVPIITKTNNSKKSIYKVFERRNGCTAVS